MFTNLGNNGKVFIAALLAFVMCYSLNSLAQENKILTANERLAELSKKMQSGEIGMEEYTNQMQEILQLMAQQTSQKAQQVKVDHEAEQYAGKSPSEKLIFLIDTTDGSSTDKLVKLIEDGADVNFVQNYTKESPLHKAAKHGHLEITKFLIENGANKFLRSYKGWTAAQLAQGNDYLAVANYLDPERKQKAPRYRKTESELVGNWQSVSDPEFMLRIRKDLTLLKSDNVTEPCVCFWSFSKDNRRLQRGGININYSKNPKLFDVDDQGVIIKKVKHSAGMRFEIINNNLFIERKGGLEKLIPIPSDDDDMDFTIQDRYYTVDLKKPTLLIEMPE